MIAEALAGKTILVTGSTGFLGKTIVEKCLRSLPQVGRIELAIRPGPRRVAAERLEREVLASPAFRVLRQNLGEKAFARLAAEKLSVLELDLGVEGLGLDEKGRGRLKACDVVIHSAAAVEFDNPADLSARTNVLGTARLITELRRAGAAPHLVHVSTAYVGGMLRGQLKEELPLDPGLNWRHEAEALTGLRAVVEEESRRPEELRRLSAQARSRMGPAGTPATARMVERLRQRWVKEALVERGRARARATGFTDIYSFTKALAEHALVELRGEIPLSIVRPSVIESALAEPFPGWLEGFRMAEPIILAFGRGVLTEFSGLPDGVIDIVPADLVVSALLAVAASPPEGGHRIYHVASGTRNPLRFRGLYEQSARYFAEHPLRDRHGQAIGTHTWTFPNRSQLEARGRLALRALEAAQWLAERLPLGADGAEVSDRLHARIGHVERGLEFAELYGVYTEVDGVFDTSHLMELWGRLPEPDRALLPFDPGLFDWTRYLQEVHLPTVVRMARADTGQAAARQPTGGTA
ncbi:MAG: SDR family oxidoreductase, partial [Candidatus Dormibacterales bacterium]